MVLFVEPLRHDLINELRT